MTAVRDQVRVRRIRPDVIARVIDRPQEGPGRARPGLPGLAAEASLRDRCGLATITPVNEVATYLPGHPIDAIVSPADPSVTIARVELGLTLYLDPQIAWAQAGAASVLRYFLEIVPPEYLCWYSTSHMEGWRKVERETQAEMADLLPLPWSQGAPRHLFEFEITDDVECASCGFWYREIDSGRAGRAGIIEVTLPQEFHPGHLLNLARAAFQAGPLWAGIGGYVVRLGRRYRADAFDVAWAWSRRFSGLDIQDAERAAWRATAGLPGVNWLTLLGSSLAPKFDFDVEVARRHSWIDPMISCEVASGNLLIAAGEAPTLGDGNRFEEPTAYREVASVARKLFYDDPPEFLGRFRDEGSTEKWFRRLLSPGPLG